MISPIIPKPNDIWGIFRNIFAICKIYVIWFKLLRIKGTSESLIQKVTVFSRVHLGKHKKEIPSHPPVPGENVQKSWFSLLSLSHSVTWVFLTSHWESVRSSPHPCIPPLPCGWSFQRTAMARRQVYGPRHSAASLNPFTSTIQNIMQSIRV